MVPRTTNVESKSHLFGSVAMKRVCDVKKLSSEQRKASRAPRWSKHFHDMRTSLQGKLCEGKGLEEYSDSPRSKRLF
jgi:hypothetical protein